jgi:hypothetical protein
MLYAIFILLLIVFFPLLSLLLGVGFMVVLAKFWWLFLIIAGLMILCGQIDKREAREKEEARLKKQQQEIIGAIKASNQADDPRVSFSGEPDLSNDSYILHLVKKYSIEKNEVLGKFVLNQKLYDSIDEALKVGNLLDKAEREEMEQASALRAKEDEIRHREMMASRKADIKKLLLLLIAIILLIVIGRMAYLYCWYQPPKANSSATHIYDWGTKKAYVHTPINDEGKIKAFWLKMVDTDGGYQEHRLEMNCSERLFREVQVNDFDSQGKEFYSESKPFSNWDVINPKTNYDLVLNFVCQK